MYMLADGLQQMLIRKLSATTNVASARFELVLLSCCVHRPATGNCCVQAIVVCRQLLCAELICVLLPVLQMSNVYKEYKSVAEQQLEQLQQERDTYKEELQLTLTTGPGTDLGTGKQVRPAAQ
jgi:hypothetical protein